MRTARNPRREVEWNGRFYKVKSNSIAIPDLRALPRIEALLWLCSNTYPKGYSRPNLLAGFGSVISITAR